MSNRLTSRGVRLAFAMAFMAQFVVSAGPVRSAGNLDMALTYPVRNSVNLLAQTVRPQNAQVKSPTSLTGTWQTLTTSNSQLPGNYVVSLASDFQQNILAGTMPDETECYGGLSTNTREFGLSTIYGGSDIEDIQVSMENPSAHKPTARIITSLPNGDIWFGPLQFYYGISCLTQAPRVLHPDGTFQDVYIPIADLHTLVAIAGDAAGNIWFGSGYGVYVLHPDGSGQSFTSSNSGLVSSYVFALSVDAAQNIWVGTQSGVSVLHTDGTWSTYTTANSGLASNYVRVIRFGVSDAFFGTGEGLSILHADGSWQSYTYQNSGLGTIQTMAIDGAGDVWLGTYYGVRVLHTDGTWQIYNTTNSGLTGNDIRSIIVDAGQNIWFGTWGGGLTEYGKPGSQFDRISMSPSAPMTVELSSLVYITVTLNGATLSDDVRGAQLSISASGLSPATDQPVRLGSLIPASSYRRTISTATGFQFILNLPITSQDVISGEVVIAAFPFYASSVSTHASYRLDDHLLTDSQTNSVYNHLIYPAQTAVGSWGELSSGAYLQTRLAQRQGGIGVALSGSLGDFATVTDAMGHFTFTQIISGTYTAAFSHTLFITAVRPFTVTGSMLTIPPDTGLWAGDMNQSNTVDDMDWYICAAASIPVSDSSFDLNGDRNTDIRDCTIVASNIGRVDMSTTNAPRSGLGSPPLYARSALAQEAASWALTLKPLASGDWSLRSSGVNGFLYASGARLSLPAGAAISSVNLAGGYAGGFLNWHQDGAFLYIVATPGTRYVPMRDTDIAVIHLASATSGSLTVDAQNLIGVQGRTVYLPLSLR